MASVIIKSTLTFSFCYFVFTSGTFGLMDGAEEEALGSIKSGFISVQNMRICHKQKRCYMEVQMQRWLPFAQKKSLT